MSNQIRPLTWFKTYITMHIVHMSYFLRFWSKLFSLFQEILTPFTIYNTQSQQDSRHIHRGRYDGTLNCNKTMSW